MADAFANVFAGRLSEIRHAILAAEDKIYKAESMLRDDIAEGVVSDPDKNHAVVGMELLYSAERELADATTQLFAPLDSDGNFDGVF